MVASALLLFLRLFVPASVEPDKETLRLYFWTHAAMEHFAPPEKAPQFPGHEETVEDTGDRYVQIAWTIAQACAEDSFPRSCAALAVSQGLQESRFARDADIGPCYRKGVYRSRCGGGLAASVWQAEAFGKDKDGAAITVARLFAERDLAVGVYLRQARWSLKKCRDLSGLTGKCVAGPGPWDDRLREYRRVRAWEPSP